MDVILITAILGGMAGWLLNGFDAMDEIGSARKQAEDYKKYIEAQYEYEKEDAEENWKLDKENAKKQSEKLTSQADYTDLKTDLSEKGLSNDFNQAIDQLYLQQSQNAFNYNMQAMQYASNEGNALASVAASGVRSGSSMSDAVLMESMTNSAQLQFAKDTNRNYEKYSLQNVLNSLAGEQAGFRLNRISADQDRDTASDLLASFAEGGSRWNIYQNQLKSLKTKYEYEKNKAQNVIDENSGWRGNLKILGRALGGFGAGAKTGYNFASFGTGENK